MQVAKAQGNPQWEEKGVGEALTPQMAEAAAYVQLIKKLQMHFVQPNSKYFLTQRRLREMLTAMLEVKMALHMARGKQEKTRKSRPKKTASRMLKPVKDSPQKHHIRFDQQEHTLYIGKSAQACLKHQHKITPATGIMQDLRGKAIKINVNYCEKCDVYFISSPEYKHYRETYGPLLGKIDLFQQAHVNSNGDIYANLKEESILQVCGYTVRKDALTKSARRRILAYMMDYDIAPKAVIIDHIQFNIRTRQHMPRMREAIDKWEADLEWVRRYKMETQRQVRIKVVKRKA